MTFLIAQMKTNRRQYRIDIYYDYGCDKIHIDQNVLRLITVYGIR